MLTTFDKSLVAVLGSLLATAGTLFPNVVTPTVTTAVITLVTALLVYFVPNATPATPVSNTVANTSSKIENGA